MYIVTWQKMVSLFPAWALYFLVGIVILRFFSVLAVWFWSKSGVVAYVLLSVVAMTLLVSVGQNLSLLGIGGAIILVALVWRKWQYMSWGVSSVPKESRTA
jgi:hypothetical protein